MATVIHEPVGPDALPEASAANSAVGRVTAYFQYLGLGPQEASRWAEQVVRDACDGSSQTAEECTERAVDRAMVLVDKWVSRLTAFCPDRSDDLSAQLKWHLRPVLRQHPEAFLQTSDLPDDVHRAIREAARPILPPLIPAVMPAQSLGNLPRPWQRFVVGANVIRYRLLKALWRRGRRA